MKPRKPSSESITSGYEHTQPTLRAMVVFVLCVAVAAVIIHFGLDAMYHGLVAAEDHPAASPLATPSNTMAFVKTNDPGPLAEGPMVTPNPRLQPSGARNEPPLDHIDAAEMARFRYKENTLLHTYSIDALTGHLSIPIDQAMQLVLPNLPTRPEAPPHEAVPTDGGGFR
jgi:hypothetical protein